MENVHEANLRKNASTALLGAWVDMAHSVAYPMVSEVIKTQASLTERVEHNEIMVEGNTASVTILTARMDAVVAETEDTVADAIANMQNAPEMDETIAKMQSEINRMQAQIQGLIDALLSVANLE